MAHRPFLILISGQSSDAKSVSHHRVERHLLYCNEQDGDTGTSTSVPYLIPANPSIKPGATASRVSFSITDLPFFSNQITEFVQRQNGFPCRSSHGKEICD